MWNRSSTYERFYSNFQKKTSSLKKGKSRVKSEKLPLRRRTLGKISPRYEFIRIMWFFWKNSRGCKSFIFSWKSIWTDISDWVWRNIFCRLFSRSFFLRARRKYSAKKTPQKLSQWKFKKSQEKYQPARTLEKLCKT